MTVLADADFTLDAEGNIVFDFADPALHMDFVTASPWAVNGENVESVMEAVVDILIPSLMETLGGLGGFEMPELGGEWPKGLPEGVLEDLGQRPSP